MRAGIQCKPNHEVRRTKPDLVIFICPQRTVFFYENIFSCHTVLSLLICLSIFILRRCQINLIRIQFRLDMLLGIEIGQKYYRLNVRSKREHIKGTYFFDLVSVLC